MEVIGYRATLNLAGLQGAEVETREVDGQLEKVLVLPMRINGIVQKKTREKYGVFMRLTIFPQKGGFYNQSHYITLTPNREVAKERQELGLRPNPIIGNMSELFKKFVKDVKGSLSKIDEIIYGDF